jgi:hypothetical protein
MRVFEVDQPGQLAWKRQRLVDLGYGIPGGLPFAPVGFEANDDWYTKLVEAGLDAAEPPVVASTGVSMCLTKEANRQMLERVARFKAGSTLVIAFTPHPGCSTPPTEPVLKPRRVARGGRERRSSVSTHRRRSWSPQPMRVSAPPGTSLELGSASGTSSSEPMGSGHPAAKTSSSQAPDRRSSHNVPVVEAHTAKPVTGARPQRHLPLLGLDLANTHSQRALSYGRLPATGESLLTDPFSSRTDEAHPSVLHTPNEPPGVLWHSDGPESAIEADRGQSQGPNPCSVKSMLDGFRRKRWHTDRDVASAARRGVADLLS